METVKKNPQPGQYLTFCLKSQQYGVPISNIREINQYSEITNIPNAPEFVVGVMNLRGKVIPVVDLRLKFSMESVKPTRETCIIVIESDLGLVGMIVDSVSEVLDLAAEQIEPPPSIGEDERLSYVLGIGKSDKKVIILVDIVRSLSKEAFEQVTQRRQPPAPTAAAA